MMPHAAPATYTGSQWLPKRVARRLIAKHGAGEALVRVTRQQQKHAQRMRQSELRRRTPFLLIYWDIVSLAVAKAVRAVPPAMGSAA